MVEALVSSTPAVTSAVRVLDAVSSAPHPLSFSELQQRLELPKSSLSRLLQTLTELQLLELSQGQYQIGPRVLDYSASYTRRLDVIGVFHKVADDLGEQINETMQLAQLQHSEVVFLAKRDCSRLIRPAAYPGRRMPAHATAVGKALLAHLPPEEILRRYPARELPALTPFTITDRDTLLSALETVRTLGYADTNQESTLSLCCFSSPIRDATGTVIAALSICLATEMPSSERRENAAHAALSGAQRISHALGYRAPLAP